MNTLLLVYYEQSGELLHLLINIFDNYDIKEDAIGQMKSINKEIKELLSLKCRKQRIQLLTEADRSRILTKSKSEKVERLPALLKVVNGKIVKVVYLEAPDEFEIALKL